MSKLPPPWASKNLHSRLENLIFFTSRNKNHPISLPKNPLLIYIPSWVCHYHEKNVMKENWNRHITLVYECRCWVEKKKTQRQKHRWREVQSCIWSSEMEHNFLKWRRVLKRTNIYTYIWRRGRIRWELLEYSRLCALED